LYQLHICAVDFLLATMLTQLQHTQWKRTK